MTKTFTIFFCLFVIACSPEIKVRTDFDPDCDLWTYKTFDWGQKVNIEGGKNPLHYNELNDKRIKSAVHNQLASRGYVLTDSNPDLILHYHIMVEDKSVLVTEPFGYTYGSYWTRLETNIYPYREGTLILDLMDSKTKNLIWRGWAVSPLDKSYSPDKIEKLVNKVVMRIFRNFPKTRNQRVIQKELTLN